METTSHHSTKWVILSASACQIPIVYIPMCTVFNIDCCMLVVQHESERLRALLESNLSPKQISIWPARKVWLKLNQKIPMDNLLFPSRWEAYLRFQFGAG